MRSMAQQSSASPSSSNSHRGTGTLDDGEDDALEPKHKVFLSHSSFQKGFVEHLCAELEGCFRFPFFDKRRESLPIGENFPGHIFDAIRQCDVGLVILSEEFLTSKWPMMELVAMHDRVVDEVEKGKSTFRMIPVFFRTSPKEFDDLVNHSRWLACWNEFAQENPGRVNVEKWEAAVKYLRSLKGLVYDGMGEVRFQKEVVDEICKVVPPEIRMEDSHIVGKSRLCKVLQGKIDALNEKKNHEVCVVGLYGMGGMGKTSICKALCNEFFTQFRGRVCHAELERGSKTELLREVLKTLTNTSRERLEGFNVDQLQNALKEGIINDAVFLALDNMSDTDASIGEVKSYLLGRLPFGSIVMVTARSRDWLLRVGPFINESKCMEMPELMLEEAKSLIAKSSDLELRSEVDEQLVLRCVKRCYFRKDDGSGSCHYHPLALDVLGRQLSRLTDLREWVVLLDRIDEDIFNQSKENNHPIFSILRKSFDTLSPEDQLLFMDVARFLHGRFFVESGWSVYEWLGVVHKIPRVGDVMRALERLKTKALLERLGEGFGYQPIGMHDLWRAFCVAETKYGELGRRRWLYEAVNCSSELVESRPSGNCWESVKRMAFLYGDSRSLEKVNFGHFSNVTVLKIFEAWMSKKVVVDLSGLIYLKSLEVSGWMSCNLVIQGLPRHLIFLTFDSVYWSELPCEQWVQQIACLEELQYLGLNYHTGGKLPDMRSMLSLCVAMFEHCWNVVTVTGLSSKLTNLRVLNLRGCEQLRSCPGVGDLVALEELNCWGCGRLERLPNLRKLRNLRKLNMNGCELITELPGLSDLVALEELHVKKWFQSEAGSKLKLADMSKLRNLGVLLLGRRRLEALPGFERLISLQKVDADFREMVDRPRLRQLTMLRELRIRGWSLAELRGVEGLAVLHTLDVVDCWGVDELPDFRSLISLRTLWLEACEFKDVSSLSNSSTLEEIRITGCRKLERLPDLQRLTRLKSLWASDCDMLRGFYSTLGRGEESSCSLRELTLWGCNNFADVTRIGAFLQLERLEIGSLPVRELPDLSNFSQLKYLKLEKCEFVTRLTNYNLADVTSIGGFSQLEWLEIASLPVRELPDLSNFPRLRHLIFHKCDFLTKFTSSMSLPALSWLSVLDCGGLKALPDLEIFPALDSLQLSRCRALSTLSCSKPLTALNKLYVSECKNLSEDDLDHLRALCPPRCEIHCEGVGKRRDPMRLSRLFQEIFQRMKCGIRTQLCSQ